MNYEIINSGKDINDYEARLNTDHRGDIAND